MLTPRNGLGDGVVYEIHVHPRDGWDRIGNRRLERPIRYQAGRGVTNTEVGMNVRVDPNRFLSVACEPDERIVFDRQETKYHLLRDSAARLWDEICEGGTFEIATTPGDGQDPVTLLAEAGLLGIDERETDEGITRRVWLRKTGKVSAAAFVLPLVASISAPRLVLGQVDASVEELLEPTGSNTPLAEETKAPAVSETSSSGDKLSRDQRRDAKGGNGIGGSSQPFESSSPGNSDGENGTRTRRRSGQQQLTTTQNGPSSTGLIKRRDRDR